MKELLFCFVARLLKLSLPFRIFLVVLAILVILFVINYQTLQYSWEGEKLKHNFLINWSEMDLEILVKTWDVLTFFVVI